MMAVLLDKLSQRGIKRFKGAPPQTTQPSQTAQPSPLPSITETINRPPVSQRISALPQQGAVGSLPQFKNIKQRLIADLPAKTQLEGIQSILSGQDSQNAVINNFVKGLASQGKSPEEIRQAFIDQQKTSPSPLVLL